MSNSKESLTEKLAIESFTKQIWVDCDYARRELGMTEKESRNCVRDLTISKRYTSQSKILPVKKEVRTYFQKFVLVTEIRPNTRKARPVVGCNADRSVVIHYPSAYSTQVDGFDATSVLLAAAKKMKATGDPRRHGSLLWYFKEDFQND